MFLDGSNKFISFRQNVRPDTNTGTWTMKQTFLRRVCPGTLKDVLGFEMPIVCHTEEIGYPRRLIQLARNVDVTPEYQCFDLYCIENLLDGFYIVKDADAW